MWMMNIKSLMSCGYILLNSSLISKHGKYPICVLEAMNSPLYGKKVFK